MVGFAFGFLAREHGETTLHSHMLAVLDPYGIWIWARALKHAQRERAMAMVSMNDLDLRSAAKPQRALHFFKLGVVSDTYKANFYGPETRACLASETDRPALGAVDTEFEARAESTEGKSNARAEALDALKLLASAGALRSQREARPRRSGRISGTAAREH